MWEHFHHQADVGIRGIGQTLEEAFTEGAYALSAVMCNPQKVRPRVPIQIRAEAADRELLFADWLNQILYEIDTQKMFFSRFEIRLENNSLTGTAWGEPADPDRHESAVDVKAATYLMLKVNCQGDRWIAQCVVDV